MLLLTRPLEDSQQLAATLAPIPCHIEPLLKISRLHCEIETKNAEAIVITSRHALPAVHALNHLPLYCVGEHTAKLAENIGFSNITYAINVNHLIPQLPPDKPLLYARGKNITARFPGNVQEAIVYDAIATTAFNQQTLASWNAITGVVLCSARTAEIFISLCQYHTAPLPKNAYCLSNTIAQATTQACQAADLPTPVFTVCNDATPTLDNLCRLIHEHHPN